VKRKIGWIYPCSGKLMDSSALQARCPSVENLRWRRTNQMSLPQPSSQFFPTIVTKYPLKQKQLWKNLEQSAANEVWRARKSGTFEAVPTVSIRFAVGTRSYAIFSISVFKALFYAACLHPSRLCTYLLVSGIIPVSHGTTCFEYGLTSRRSEV
jgi:hypothetical protein